MKEYQVELDVTLVFRATVEAESKEEAIERAERQAYEDSWCTKMSWDGSKVYECEVAEEEEV